MPDLITLGETMVLFRPLTEGPLQSVYHFEKRYAGAESNVAIATVRLTVTVRAFATATAGDVEGYPTLAQVRAFWAGHTPRER